MITVHCPACDAAYQIDEGKLPAEGRKLRCAKCKVVWLALKPEAEDAAENAADAATDAAAAAAAEPPHDTPVPEAGAQPADEAAATDVPDDMPDDADAQPVQRDYDIAEVTALGGWRHWVRGPNAWRSGAVGLLLLGLLCGGGVVALKLMPAGDGAPAKRLEAPVEDAAADTADVITPPQGVVLHGVHGDVAALEDGAGGVSLTVRGLLANTTSRTLVVPPLRLELLGPDGKVADRWPVSGVGGDLAGGAEQAWTVSLTAPDMSAMKGWRVVFVKAPSAPVPAIAAE